METELKNKEEIIKEFITEDIPMETIRLQWKNKVITYIKKVTKIHYKKRLGFFCIKTEPIVETYYTIEQSVPYIPDDDNYDIYLKDTNKKLKTIAMTEYTTAVMYAIMNGIDIKEKK